MYPDGEVGAAVSGARAATDPVAIGPYRVRRLLGEGGMGRVYLAVAPDGRLVAVKVVRVEYAGDREFRIRFDREVAAASRVSGAHTCPVIDADTGGPVPWLATAYLPAPSLAEAVREFGPLPEAALRALGAGLTDALAAIHTAGLIHRDLKPANVLLSAAGPRVIDFGISRAADRTQLTRTGGYLGTPGYMAPEQAASGQVQGPASDVFSLGCVLVYAATGAPPFGVGDVPSVLFRVVHEPPNLEGVPTGLLPLLTACLDKDPAARPGLPDVLTELGPVEPAALLSPQLQAELARRQQEIVVPPTAVLQPPPMPNRRRFLRIAGIGAAALAAVGSVVAVALTGDSTPADDQTGPTQPTDPPLPSSPAPTWTRALGATFNDGGLGVMGNVLVRWDKATALAFDAATGAPRWTGRPTLPDGYRPGFSWIGVHGSSLIGTTQHADTNSNLLFAIGPDGTQRFSHDVGRSGQGKGLNQVLDVAGDIALFSTTVELVAIDMSTGKQLWTRKLKAFMQAATVIDGQRCYLQDSTDTVCLDLATGNQLWATPNTFTENVTSIVLVAGALAIAGDKLVVLDAATGVQRRTVLQASTGIRRVGVSAGLLVVGEHNETASGDDNHTVWGIDPRDGTKVWATHIPLPMVTGVTATSANLVVVRTSTRVSVKPAGFIVLQGKTGAIGWAESGGGTADWLACATPDGVYAASSTTAYAYHQP